MTEHRPAACFKSAQVDDPGDLHADEVVDAVVGDAVADGLGVIAPVKMQGLDVRDEAPLGYRGGECGEAGQRQRQTARGGADDGNLR